MCFRLKHPLSNLNCFQCAMVAMNDEHIEQVTASGVIYSNRYPHESGHARIYLATALGK